jgi:hypothetical protein
VGSRSDALADKAVSLCGADFRLHGREAATGLDCIGLTNLCLLAAGLECDVPTGYSIRGGAVQSIIETMKLSGFVEIPDREAPRDGDVFLVRPSSIQLHFMICTEGGFVHAHAGLRKVVFSPGRCPWPILHIFRILET